MEPIKLIPLVSGRAEEWSNGCEHFAAHLTYDMSAVLGVWPDAAPSVAFERADGEKYAHEFIVAENILHIPLTLADTAVAGACKCVVTMISQDGRVNSDVYHGRVTVGIDTLGEEPTDPQLGIIEQVNNAAARAEIAAKDAEGTLEEVVSAGEAQKQEIADAGAEQIENIQNSEMVKDLIKDAISEHFEENAITAEAIGAASADDLRNHEENKENPHAVTAEQVGAASKDAFNAHAENKENPHHVTLQQLGGLPDTYVAPVASVNGKTDAVVLTAADVGALPDTYEAPVASVNGKTGEVSIAHSDVGAAPATEDATYPGCYYRMVGGVKEWINPPMQIGVEYRTTERYNGKTVYVTAISLGTLPASGEKGTTYTESTSPATAVVHLAAYAKSASGTINQFPFYNSSGVLQGKASATSSKVYIDAFKDMSSNTGYAIIKYTKD
jgi:hypothetical protein